MSLRSSIEHFQNQTCAFLIDDLSKVTDDVMLARYVLERMNAHFHETMTEMGSALSNIKNINISLISTNIGKPITPKSSTPK